MKGRAVTFWIVCFGIVTGLMAPAALGVIVLSSKNKTLEQRVELLESMVLYDIEYSDEKYSGAVWSQERVQDSIPRADPYYIKRRFEIDAGKLSAKEWEAKYESPGCGP